jgi:predicted methyltransferase
MITLSTDLVQQFYTHQQVRDNQAVIITSFKKNFNHFLDEVISKGRIFFLVSGGRVRTADSHTHTQAQK